MQIISGKVHLWSEKYINNRFKPLINRLRPLIKLIATRNAKLSETNLGFSCHLGLLVLLWAAEATKPRTKATLKQARREISSLGDQKTDKKRINPKCMKIQFQTPSCPSYFSHGPPGCSQGVEMVPHGAKMEAPSPPNGNHEELKEAGGRGRSPQDKSMNVDVLNYLNY